MTWLRQTFQPYFSLFETVSNTGFWGLVNYIAWFGRLTFSCTECESADIDSYLRKLNAMPDMYSYPIGKLCCKDPISVSWNFLWSFMPSLRLPAPQGCYSAQTLHYIIIHYITLHYITLHYIILLYITMVYCNLHCIYNMLGGPAHGMWLQKGSIAALVFPFRHTCSSEKHGTIPTSLLVFVVNIFTSLYIICHMSLYAWRSPWWVKRCFELSSELLVCSFVQRNHSILSTQHA